MPEDKKKRMTNEVTLVGNLIWIAEKIEQRGKAEILRARIEQPGQYPNIFEIEFLNNRIDDLLEFEDHIGAEVRVRASLNGREWEKKETGAKYLFLTITGWSIKPSDAPESTRSKSEKRLRKEKESGISDDEMPGDSAAEEATETPDAEKSEKRKARQPKPEPGAEIKDDDDLPY